MEFLSLVDDDCDAIRKEVYTGAEIEAGFNAFDQDGSGTVTKKELVTALTEFNAQDKANISEDVSRIVNELVADLAVKDSDKYKNVITRVCGLRLCLRGC